MLKLNRVLFPVDLDNLSEGVLDKALDLAEQYQSEIHFLYVNSPQAGYRTPFEHEDQVALKVKDMVSDHMRLDDLRIIYKTLRGDVEEQVIEYSHEIQADIIVVGQSHHTPLFERLFGSNDGKIIEKSDVPVLVLPNK